MKLTESPNSSSFGVSKDAFGQWAVRYVHARLLVAAAAGYWWWHHYHRRYLNLVAVDYDLLYC